MRKIPITIIAIFIFYISLANAKDLNTSMKNDYEIITTINATNSTSDWYQYDLTSISPAINYILIQSVQDLYFNWDATGNNTEKLVKGASDYQYFPSKKNALTFYYKTHVATSDITVMFNGTNN